MASLMTKPVAWFKVASQVRQHFDDLELQRLGESLKTRQLQPVLAKSDGTLIAGERRLRAAKLVGLTELQVIVSDEPMSETDLRIVQLAENIHRADLTDAEKWQACEELLQLNAGWTNKDLAAHLKLAESTVTKYLSATRCIPEVQQALVSGEIGITTTYEISRADVGQQAGLLALKRSGASRDGLARQVRQAKAKDVSASKTKPAAKSQIKRIVCPLASGVSISVSGTELSLDGFIESLAEAQKEAKKAREQLLDAKTFAAVMKDKARKVGA
ncbi:ParB/RepB/Spo0J family partition protein [bacterium]|nr:ParB/RepB/Spo0J family partition protein [bacterium]